MNHSLKNGIKITIIKLKNYYNYNKYADNYIFFYFANIIVNNHKCKYLYRNDRRKNK